MIGMLASDPRARSTAATVSFLAVALVAAALGGVYLMGSPSVVGVENRFGAVDQATTEIRTDVIVENPAPVGVALGDAAVEYAVSLNDVRMADGRRTGIRLDPGRTTVPLSTRMSNGKIPEWWVTHVRNGERSVLSVDAAVVSGTLGRELSAPTITRRIDTDVVSGFDSAETRPLNATVGGSNRTVLYLNRTEAAWGTVTDNRTDVQMTLTVYNPNSHPVAVSAIDYDIRMNGVEVGSGTTDGTRAIPPESRRTIQATTTIRNDKLDEWWVTHVRNHQTTRLRASFYLRFDLPVGGSVRVPVDDLTERIETDIFGTKAAAGSNATAGDRSAAL